MKLHLHFSHPNPQKLISLLKDANVDDNELIAMISDVSDNCEICFKYKNSRPRAILGFPLVKHFNETVALDSKKKVLKYMVPSYDRSSDKIQCIMCN